MRWVEISISARTNQRAAPFILGGAAAGHNDVFLPPYAAAVPALRWSRRSLQLSTAAAAAVTTAAAAAAATTAAALFAYEPGASAAARGA